MNQALELNNIEAEEAVIGSILIYPESLEIVKAIPLRPDDFFIIHHEQIYRAMIALFERGDAIDVRTVADELFTMYGFEKAREEKYLNKITNDIPSAMHAQTYGLLVYREAVRRNLSEVGAVIKALANNRELDTNDAVAQAQQVVFDLSRLNNNSLVTFSDALLSVANDMADGREGNEPVRKMTTYWTDLNKHLYLRAGNLVIFAGRPGEGKSAALVQIATWSAKKGLRGLVASMEMSEKEIVQRIIAQELGIPTDDQAQLPESQWKEFLAWVKSRSTALNGITFETSSSVTPAVLAARCRKLKRESGLDYVVIDYVQLMHSDGKFQNRNLEIGDITRRLKELARKLDIIIIIAAQLSRAGVNAGQRPKLHHLRESGNLEQDADSVVFIFNPNKVDDDDEPQDGKRLFIIAKQRNGPTSATVGDIPVVFIGSKIKFENARTF